jgi:hypothetical protein
MKNFSAIAGRPVRRYSVGDDLKHFPRPFRLRDHFGVKDAFYIGLIAVLIAFAL